MYNYPLSIGMDLALSINNSICNKISNFRSSCRIEEIQESSSEIEFIFFGKYNHAFCKLEVHTSQITDTTFVIEVFAESTHDDSDKVDFTNFRVDEILEKYKELSPVVTESIIHHPNDLQGETRGARRNITIRFRTCYESYESDEEDSYVFDFNLEEITKKSEPYIQALYEIQNQMNPKR